MKKVKLFWLILLGLMVNVSIAQDLDEVLNAHFEAVNQEAIVKLNSMHIQGKSGRMGQDFHFEIWQQRPNKYRMEVDIQGQKMIQMYDGEKAYFVAPWTGSLEPQVMGETETDQMKEQADMDGDLWNWKEKGSQLTLEGSEEFEGAEVFILKLIKKNGDQKTIYLDGDSYLPIKISSKVQMQGAETEMEVFMSNYKEVNGMLMAHYIETRMGEQVVSAVSIEKIDIDVDIPADKFEKPSVPKTEK